MSDDLSEEGRHDESRGKLEETIGREAGLKRLETEGRVHQAEGAVKQGLGDASDAVDDAVDDAHKALKD